jgi:membrane protein CcdC involved in cytochrome C biogenesis
MLIVLDYRKMTIYVLKLRAKTRAIALVALVLGPPLLPADCVWSILLVFYYGGDEVNSSAILSCIFSVFG